MTTEKNIKQPAPMTSDDERLSWTQQRTAEHYIARDGNCWIAARIVHQPVGYMHEWAQLPEHAERIARLRQYMAEKAAKKAERKAAREAKKNSQNN